MNLGGSKSLRSAVTIAAKKACKDRSSLTLHGPITSLIVSILSIVQPELLMLTTMLCLDEASKVLVDMAMCSKFVKFVMEVTTVSQS